MSAWVNVAACALEPAKRLTVAKSTAVKIREISRMLFLSIAVSLNAVISTDLWSFLLAFGLDLASVVVLSYGLYYRRHRNRDMAVAISSINITLFALTGALSAVTLPLGVGFALFAVISVIRLRSDEAGWIEMAYLLAGLGIGLIIGLLGVELWMKFAYTAFLVAMIAVIDNGKFLTRSLTRTIQVTLEGTNIADDSVKPRVEALLGREVDAVVVRNITAVPAATKVQVQYREKSAK